MWGNRPPLVSATDLRWTQADCSFSSQVAESTAAHICHSWLLGKVPTPLMPQSQEARRKSTESYRSLPGSHGGLGCFLKFNNTSQLGSKTVSHFLPKFSDSAVASTLAGGHVLQSRVKLAVPDRWEASWGRIQHLAPLCFQPSILRSFSWLHIAQSEVFEWLVKDNILSPSRVLQTILKGNMQAWKRPVHSPCLQEAHGSAMYTEVCNMPSRGTRNVTEDHVFIPRTWSWPSWQLLLSPLPSSSLSTTSTVFPSSSSHWWTEFIRALGVITESQLSKHKHRRNKQASHCLTSGPLPRLSVTWVCFFPGH